MFNAFFKRLSTRSNADARRYVETEYCREIHAAVRSGISRSAAIDLAMAKAGIKK